MTDTPCPKDCPSYSMREAMLWGMEATVIECKGRLAYWKDDGQMYPKQEVCGKPREFTILSEFTCDIRQCDEKSIATAEIDSDGQTTTIHLCKRHIPLAQGGAIFREYLQNEEGTK